MAPAVAPVSGCRAVHPATPHTDAGLSLHTLAAQRRAARPAGPGTRRHTNRARARGARAEQAPPRPAPGAADRRRPSLVAAGRKAAPQPQLGDDRLLLLRRQLPEPAGVCSFQNSKIYTISSGRGLCGAPTGFERGAGAAPSDQRDRPDRARAARSDRAPADQIARSSQLTRTPICRRCRP